MIHKVAKVSSLLAFEVGAIAVLHRLSAMPWIVRLSELWNPSVPIEDALASSLRLIALAVAYWLAGSTALYAIAHGANLRRTTQVLHWFTIPLARRLVERSLAVTLTLSSLTTPAAFADDEPLPPPPTVTGYTPQPAGRLPNGPPVVIVTDDGIVIPPGVTVPDTTTAQLLPTQPESSGEDGDAITTPLPVPIGQPTQATTSVGEYEVAPGDNLWSIAEGVLRDRMHGDPTSEEIAGYWIEVIAANESRIRSGDPDLIYPGEIVVLPNPEGV